MSDSDTTQPQDTPVEEATTPEIPQTGQTSDSSQNMGSTATDTPDLAPEPPQDAPTPVPVEDQYQGINQPEGQTTETAKEPEIMTNAPPATNFLHDLLLRARSAIQSRKRKKLDKIMTSIALKNKISNDDVQKLLYVSDATATRYLNILEQQGKIKQTGRTGKFVFYTKVPSTGSGQV